METWPVRLLSGQETVYHGGLRPLLRDRQECRGPRRALSSSRAPGVYRPQLRARPPLAPATGEEHQGIHVDGRTVLRRVSMLRPCPGRAGDQLGYAGADQESRARDRQGIEINPQTVPPFPSSLRSEEC